MGSVFFPVFPPGYFAPPVVCSSNRIQVSLWTVHLKSTLVVGSGCFFLALESTNDFKMSLVSDVGSPGSLLHVVELVNTLVAAGGVAFVLVTVARGEAAEVVLVLESFVLCLRLSLVLVLSGKKPTLFRSEFIPFPYCPC